MRGPSLSDPAVPEMRVPEMRVPEMRVPEMKVPEMRAQEMVPGIVTVTAGRLSGTSRPSGGRRGCRRPG
jgi:hypothetical protein